MSSSFRTLAYRGPTSAETSILPHALQDRARRSGINQKSRGPSKLKSGAVRAASTSTTEPITGTMANNISDQERLKTKNMPFNTNIVGMIKWDITQSFRVLFVTETVWTHMNRHHDNAQVFTTVRTERTPSDTAIGENAGRNTAVMEHTRPAKSVKAWESFKASNNRKPKNETKHATNSTAKLTGTAIPK